MKLWFNTNFDSNFTGIFAKCKILGNFNQITSYLNKYFNLSSSGSEIDKYYSYKYDDNINLLFNKNTGKLSKLYVKYIDENLLVPINKDTINCICNDVNSGLTSVFSYEDYNYYINRFVQNCESRRNYFTLVLVTDKNDVILGIYPFRYSKSVSIENSGLIVRCKNKSYYIDFYSLGVSAL